MFDYVGKSRPIENAIDKVTGSMKYLMDEKHYGMLHGKVLFSEKAHARIRSIDTSAAEALPGVHFVATYFNSPHVMYNSAKRFTGHDMKPDEYMLTNIVRHYGDRVAAVAADTPEIAEKALRLIKVDYEDLPLVLDPEKALEPDTYPIHEGGNLVGTFKASTGDVEQAFEDADYVIEGRYTVPFICHVAMEPHCCVAQWGRDKLTVWTPAQSVFATRLCMTEIFGLPQNKVRMHQCVVGGGFGAKYELFLEPIAAWLSKNCGGRKVSIEISRKACFTSTRTRHACVMYIKAGVMKDGTITAFQFRDYINGGAYASSSMNINACIGSKSMMLYAIPNMDYTGYAVYTNAPIASGMRGYGSPQAVYAIEMLVDKIAATIGADPVEIRLKNLAKPGDIQPCNGASLGNCRVRECLMDAVKSAEWAKHTGVEVDGDIRRAWGFACGVHGNGVYPKMIDTTAISLRLMEDGSITLYGCTQDLGQGLVRVLTIVASEVLKIDPEKFFVVQPDTDYTRYDLGTAASRGTWVSGRAVEIASNMLLDKMKAEAAKMLQAPVENLAVGKGGYIYIDGHPDHKVTYGEIALYGQQITRCGEICVDYAYYSTGAPGTYCCDLAQVAVNVKTGEAKVEKFWAVHDAGRVINPIMIEGQIHGGLHMGLGYALREELLIDPNTGKVTNASMRKYRVFKASEMPECVVHCIEDGVQDGGPFGAKSCSEITAVAVAPAIVNAINRALGCDKNPTIQIADLPARPDRVLEAVEKAKALGLL